jgi:malonyl-CoA O-methyltransferase
MKPYFKSIKQTFWLWLSSELSERMLENLPFIKIRPSQIFLRGNFEDKIVNLLHRIYPQAKLLTDQVKQSSFQFSLENLLPWKKKKIGYLSDKEIQLVTDIDLLWAGPLNIERSEYPTFFTDAGRLLQTQGLIMFNYLGPDTAKEYWDLLSQRGKVGPDMHDTGDILLKSGFADPVMNMEYINLEYESCNKLMSDLYGMGLLSESDLVSEPLKRSFEEIKNKLPKMNLTLEVVYGHAWKANKKELGVTRVPVEQILKTYKK